MAEFTKGPWKASPVSSIVGSLVRWGDCTKGENICAVMPQVYIAVCEANAALIASSPDLFEALQAIVQSAKNGNEPGQTWMMIAGGLIDKAEAALAKAERPR